MIMAPTPRLTASAQTQRGVSSVLFMMLLGLGLSALVLAAAAHLRASQSQSRTVHAQTQAQLKAWSGAEALRQYLYPLGASEAAKLEPGAVNFQGLDGVSARISRVDPSHADCEGSTRIASEIAGSSGGAQALLGLVYCAGGQAGGGGSGGKLPINIKGNLDLSGDLKLLGDEKARMVVDGRVSGAGSLAGIHELYASGNITLGGSTSINTVFSEGSIALSGSGSYSVLNAMQDITLSGGVKAGSLTANGRVKLESNELVSVSAIGDVQLGSAKLGQLKTRGSATASNAQISGQALVERSYSEGSNGAVASGLYGQTLSVPGWNTQVRMQRQAGLVVDIKPLTPQSISQPRIDAYEYRSAANYRFERDAQNRTVVEVSQVQGLPDGRYFLTGQGDKQDWLCTSSSYSAASCLAKICAGFSEYNSCLSYQPATQTWVLAGLSMAPGVVWFKGNLSAGQGSYANSFIATGNIITAGNNVTEALNYAGHSKVCSNSQFPGLRPQTYCPSGSAEIKPQPAGNIAFAAGGSVGGVYSGGRIDLSAANHVYGDVLAGDVLITGGSTVVHGHVVAARLGTQSSGSSFGASTTIDLRNLPGSFKPGENPSGAGAPASARLLWARYR